MAEKNIHSGHRRRLTEMVSKVGLDSLSDIQAVEYFLTYIFPRGDVNPLAHKLLDAFGNFSNIVDADIEELKAVDGINEQSAKKIKNFSELFFLYTTAKMRKKTKISCVGEIVDIVEDYLRFRNVENMLFLAISSGNLITHKKLIKSTNTSQVSFSVSELGRFLASAKPTSLVVAHCHPYAKAYPSFEDKQSFEKIEKLCLTCGINFVDSYIVGEDGVYSQKDEMLIRKYVDVDELKTAFSN